MSNIKTEIDSTFEVEPETKRKDEVNKESDLCKHISGEGNSFLSMSAHQVYPTGLFRSKSFISPSYYERDGNVTENMVIKKEPSVLLMTASEPQEILQQRVEWAGNIWNRWAKCKIDALPDFPQWIPRFDEILKCSEEKYLLTLFRELVFEAADEDGNLLDWQTLEKIASIIEDVLYERGSFIAENLLGVAEASYNKRKALCLNKHSLQNKDYNKGNNRGCSQTNKIGHSVVSIAASTKVSSETFKTQSCNSTSVKTGINIPLLINNLPGVIPAQQVPIVRTQTVLNYPNMQIQGVHQPVPVLLTPVNNGRFDSVLVPLYQPNSVHISTESITSNDVSDLASPPNISENRTANNKKQKISVSQQSHGSDTGRETYQMGLQNEIEERSVELMEHDTVTIKEEPPDDYCTEIITSCALNSANIPQSTMQASNSVDEGGTLSNKTINTVITGNSQISVSNNANIIGLNSVFDGSLTKMGPDRYNFDSKKQNSTSTSVAIGTSRIATPVPAPNKDEIEQEKNGKENESCPGNTLKNNNWATNTWNDWAGARNRLHSGTDEKHIPILHKIYGNVSEKELNELLIKFIYEVRNSQGLPYPPTSIRSLIAAFQRVIRQSGWENLSLLDTSVIRFKDFHNALEARCNELLNQGIGVTKKQAQIITEQQEEVLWDKNVFSLDTPWGLLYSVYYYTKKVFGIGSAVEMEKLKVSQFKFAKDTLGDYVIFTPSSTSKNPEPVKQYKSQYNPRTYYNIIEKYLSMIPDVNDVFFMRPQEYNHKKFSSVPIGKNSLHNLISKMMKLAGFKGYYTNHSVRVTGAVAILKQEFQEGFIKERIGHTSTMAFKRSLKDHEVVRAEISCTRDPPPPKRAKKSLVVVYDSCVEEQQTFKDQNEVCSSHSSDSFFIYSFMV